MPAPLDIEQRVSLSLSVQQYLRAVESFHKASKELNDACSVMRECVPKPGRFVAEVSFATYLVTSDEEGNFEVEPIDAL